MRDICAAFEAAYECAETGVDVHHVVGSAVIACLFEPNADDVNPHSRAGGMLVEFVRACKILDSLSRAHMFASDGIMFGESHTRDAIKILDIYSRKEGA